MKPPIAEPTYENFPSALQKNRPPRDRSVGTVSLGFVDDQQQHIYQNPARLRGASVDRYRDYLTPQYYDDTYYTREDNDRRITVKHIGMPGPGSEPERYHDGYMDGGKLERQWSHPNLRPRPHPAAGGGAVSACGRRLPKTPSQPPGTIIVIETNVVQNKGSGKQLPARPQAPVPLERSGSSAAVERVGVWSTGTSAQQRSFSLPRKGTNNPVRERPQGTGRRLPPTPKQAQTAIPLQNAPKTRKRELPKPQSLELRHSNQEYMNMSNAVLGLVKSNSNNRSMNFPRLDGSPTHSECSSGSPVPRHSTRNRRNPPYHHRRRNQLDY